MRYPRLFSISAFLLLTVLNPSASWAHEEPESQCTSILAPNNSAIEVIQSPVAELSFNEYTDTLYRALSRFPSSTRETLMIMMYRDNQGPPQQARTALFDALLDKFRYTSKPERLRMKNQKVTQDRISSLAYEIKIRELMRFYGSRDSLFQTPENVINEIADLYSRLADEKERVVALGMLPPIADFPQWGKEALLEAFKKLGFSSSKAHRLFKKMNKKGYQLFTRDREGKFAIVRKGHPPYFSDYLQLPTVRTFVEYMGRRIVEGTNLEQGKSLQQMLAEDVVSTEESGALHDGLARLQAEEAKEKERTEKEERNYRKTELQKTIAKLQRQKDFIKNSVSMAENAKAPDWLRQRDAIAASSQASPVIEINPEEREAFLSFFNQLRASNLERDWTVEALKHLLITKGNMLIVGPGGTSKTRFIRQALQNLLVDGKPSYAEVQFGQESTSDEVKGPYDPRALLQEGKYERLYEQGVFKRRFVTFDEIDKARPKLHPTLFNFLADRIDPAGNRTEVAETELVVGTANKFISQLYMSPNIVPQEVQPFIDRFDYVVFVPGELELIKSSLQLSEDIDFRTTLDMGIVEKIRSLMGQVEIPLRVKLMANLLFFGMRDKVVQHQKQEEEQHAIRARQPLKPPAPYKSTKIYSPRTQKKLLDKALKAAVVLRSIKNPGSPLTATFDDLKALRYFLVMTGPSPASSRYFKDHALDPHEASQYDFVAFENSSFDSIFDRLIEGYNGTSFRKLLTELEAVSAQVEDLPILSPNASLDQALISKVHELGEKLDKLASQAATALEFPVRNHDLRAEHIFAVEHAGDLKKALERALNAYSKKLELVLERLSHEAGSL